MRRRSTFGEQRIYASHHSIMFSRKSCYFFVRPKRKRLEVCIFLGRALKAPQVRRVEPAVEDEVRRTSSASPTGTRSSRRSPTGCARRTTIRIRRRRSRYRLARNQSQSPPPAARRRPTGKRSQSPSPAPAPEPAAPEPEASTGHWALGTGHWALGTGHWALGGHRAPRTAEAPIRRTPCSTDRDRACSSASSRRRPASTSRGLDRRASG